MAMRNYGAMADGKLMRCVHELQAGHGEAVVRVQTAKNPGSLDDNRVKAEYEARQRGLIDSNYQPAEGTTIKTEARFCPECEKKKPFYMDDYVCAGCRDGIDGTDEEKANPLQMAEANEEDVDSLREKLAQALKSP